MSCTMVQKSRFLPSFTSITMSRRALSSSSSSIEPTVEAKYYIQRKDRDHPNDLFTFATTLDHRLVKRNRFSPTRELNYTPKHWDQHKSVHRRTRHMKVLFKSSPFQRLAFPDLFVTASTAIGLTYYNTEIATDYASQILLDGSAMMGATTAVGLLAAFRLNASYGRYDEGRKFWGEVNNACRDLAGNAMMWIDSPKEKDRMLNLIKAFPVILQFHLNEKGGHYLIDRKQPNYKEQIYAEFYSEIDDIYKDTSDPDFIQICSNFKNKAHVPLKTASAMRRIISENGAFVDPMYNKEMDEQVGRLVACLGMCERVLRTPIPTCFTRHTSRIFFAWSNLLPFALYAGCGPLGTLPASLLVSYAILGIEDIGVQLEEPFNILPLRQYSEGIYSGVDSIRKGYELLGAKEIPPNIVGASAAVTDEINGAATAAATTATPVEKTFVDDSVGDEVTDEEENEYRQRLAMS
eukprot:scaffold4841_cov132-Cylindrotheca_fusiformis.AAC.8